MFLSLTDSNYTNVYSKPLNVIILFINSANILLDQNWRGILTDFGVARTLSLEATTVVTQRIVGTQVYMAPEYCTGLVSPAADVFSLGMVSL